MSTYSTISQQGQYHDQERKNAPQACPHCGTPINQNLRPWDQVRSHCGSDRCRKAMSRVNITQRKRVERDEASLRIDTYAANFVTQSIKWPKRPLIDIRRYGFTLATCKPDFRSLLSKPVGAGEKPHERILKKCTIGQ